MKLFTLFVITLLAGCASKPIAISFDAVSDGQSKCVITNFTCKQGDNACKDVVLDCRIINAVPTIDQLKLK